MAVRVDEVLAWWHEIHHQDQQLFFPLGSLAQTGRAAAPGPAHPLPAQPPALPARACQSLVWMATVPPRAERAVRFNGGLVRRALEAAMDRDPVRAAGGPGADGRTEEPAPTDEPHRRKVIRLWLKALYALATAGLPAQAADPALKSALKQAQDKLKKTHPIIWTEAALQARSEFASVAADAGEGVHDPEAADDKLPMATLPQAAATEAFLHDTGRLGVGRLAALYALRVVCKALALPGDEGVLRAVRVPILNAFKEVRRAAPAEWQPLAVTLAWELEHLLQGDALTLVDRRQPWGKALFDLMPGFNPLHWLGSLDPAPLQRWLKGRRPHCPQCEAALAPWPDDWLDQARRLAAAACRDLFDPHRAHAIGWYGGSGQQPKAWRPVAGLVQEIDQYSLRNQYAKQPKDVTQPRWQAALAHRCEVRAFANWLYAIAPLPTELPVPPAPQRDTFHLKPSIRP